MTLAATTVSLRVPRRWVAGARSSSVGVPVDAPGRPRRSSPASAQVTNRDRAPRVGALAGELTDQAPTR